MRKPKKDISIRKSLCIASRYENHCVLQADMKIVLNNETKPKTNS